MINETPITAPKPVVKKKKILVGIPSWDGVVAEAQKGVFGMAYYCGRHMPEYDLAILPITKKEQFRARNNIMDAAIANDFDYVLMLDDDMVIPHNLLHRLIAHEKDVTGALYYQRGGQYHPVIMRRIHQERGQHGAHFISQVDPMITTNRGLHQVDVIGGGCMLFKTEVFKKIIQPYFATESGLGTDLAICGRLRDAGVEIWCDTSIELGHVGDKKIITSRSVSLAERTMAGVREELGKDIQEYFSMHTEEFLSAMDRAASKKARQDAWGEKRETWEEIRDYYQTNDDWHILNLAYFNLFKSDVYKEWGVTQGAMLLNRDSRVLDYGAGIGHLSVALAERVGCEVLAMDIADSPTQKVVQWRKDKRGLDNLKVLGQTGEMPEGVTRPLDGAFCISVMDHLPRPLETVKWIRDQLKPGAFFVCEYTCTSGDDEPQHLDRYDVSKFQQYMHSLGFTTSPEYDWLFFLEE